jgi:hypothetical protein
MHPDMLRLQSRFPKVTPAARFMARAGGDAGDALALVADTLAIDADGLCCSVTWRGSLPAPSDTALSDVLIAAAVTSDGQTVDWSDAHRLAVLASGVMPSSRPALGDISSMDTVVTAPASGLRDELGDEFTRTRVDPPRDADVELPLHYPRSDAGDEITDTGMETQAVDGGDATQPYRIPLAMDTEPGALGTVIEEDIQWDEAARDPFSLMGAQRAAAEPPRPPDTLESLPLPPAPPAGAALKAPDEAPRPSSRRALPPPRPRGLPPRPPPRPPLDTGARPSRKVRTLPPAPLDVTALENALRDAGASDDDIAAMLRRHKSGDEGS